MLYYQHVERIIGESRYVMRNGEAGVWPLEGGIPWQR